MALTPGQQYSPQQIFQEDPEWLKSNNPALYSQFTKEVGQPEAGLQGTKLQNQQLQETLPSYVAKSQAEAGITSQEAAKQKAFNDTQSFFNKVMGGDKKVSPQDYNKAMQDNSKYMTADEFNSRFQDTYTNPNNVFYNTPDKIAIREKIPQLTNVIKSYYNLDKSGPNWEKLTQVPGLGDYFKKTQMANEIAHDNLLSGTSAEFLKIAGAGQGSTVRGTTAELSNVVNLLPKSTDSTDTANAKLDKLDAFMQKTYGTSLKDWLGK